MIVAGGMNAPANKISVTIQRKLMSKEYKIEPASSLYEVGMAMQRGFDEGYRITEGWPVQIGWIYEVKMERDLAPTEEKRAVGRPKVDKQKEL